MSKTAFVDLTSGAVRIEETPPSAIEAFLGGRGLGAKLLFDLTDSHTEPFSPANPLVFSSGAFTGTPWPAASRYHLTFKSPLTGAYGYANAGGFWGPELARAGYDALVITGVSKDPVYLEVTDDRVRIRPATDLWGLPTTRTAAELVGKHGGRPRVAAIGPAGEKLVRFAAVINDGGRAAARCGGGAVMGSKRLKAVMLQARGQRTVPEAFRSASSDALRRLRSDRRLDGLRMHGTAVLVAPKNASGDLPACNHQWPQVPDSAGLEPASLDAYLRRRAACFGCPIGCSRISEVSSGPFACRLEGPEYESLDALGPMTGLTDPEPVLYANFLCNELGLDTISTGVVIAFAMECRQRGILGPDSGVPEWGDAEATVGLIQAIADRQGIGDTLAGGVRLASQVLGRGAETLAMHVKGLEMPRQEPRVAKGFGLGHATSNRGADHLYALPTIDVAGNWEAARANFPEAILDRLMDSADETYKPDLVVSSEHLCAVSDALGVCKFSTAETHCLGASDLAAGLSALTGRRICADELVLAGERIVNLERLYNARQGFARDEDRLPDRFVHEAIDVWAYSRVESTVPVRSDVPVRSGARIDLEPMLDRYYDLRGWTREGVPMPGTLARLSLWPLVLRELATEGAA